ncbi:MAG: site-specific integrase [Proteobacteria bacterium]|nr:site-specific integrase [Pseudomonadota bacterium]
MGLCKQAKILSKQQQEAVLSFLTNKRHSMRDKVIFLLSTRAGFRAKEVSALTWGMLTDAEGNITDAISLENVASKGKSGGIVYLNKELKSALVAYKEHLGEVSAADRVITTERGKTTTAQVIVNMICGWYKQLGFNGCSSHSGRRTFITNAAKKISTVGGSIKDVQMLARHSSLQMTQRYIESDVDAQKKVVQLV